MAKLILLLRIKTFYVRWWFKLLTLKIALPFIYAFNWVRVFWNVMVSLVIAIRTKGDFEEIATVRLHKIQTDREEILRQEELKIKTAMRETLNNEIKPN